MCNEAYRRTQIGQLREDWSQTRIPLRFPEGMSNFPPLPSIRITDRVEIIRPSREEAGEAEMVTRRWSWPGPTGKPVYNYRSDGRSFGNSESGGRCLIPIDGFFEFTDPPPPPTSPDPAVPPVKGKPLKSKWAFAVRGLEWFCLAGIWRTDPKVGEAFTLLTCPPGPDILPYHRRQMVVLTTPDDYARWLDPAVPATELCRPLPAGTLLASQVR
jgi:putative SOS response-associated peptidase YedK